MTCPDRDRVWVWNVALTTAEIDALAAGQDPRTIRPDAQPERDQ